MQRSSSRWLTKLCAEIRKLSLYHFKVFLQAFKGVTSPFKPEAVFDQYTGELIVLLFIFRFQQDHNHWLKYKTKRSPLSTVKFCPPLQRRLELWEKFGASSSQHILHMLLLFQQPLMPSTNSTQHKVFSKEQMVKHSRLHTVEYTAHYTAHTQYTLSIYTLR